MRPNMYESILITYVNTEIDSGKRRIVIPAQMLKNVRKEALREVVRLCELNGVKIITD